MDLEVYHLVPSLFRVYACRRVLAGSFAAHTVGGHRDATACLYLYATGRPPRCNLLHWPSPWRYLVPLGNRGKRLISPDSGWRMADSEAGSLTHLGHALSRINLFVGQILVGLDDHLAVSIEPGGCVPSHVRGWRRGCRISLACSGHSQPIGVVWLPGNGALDLTLVLHVRGSVLQMGGGATAKNAAGNGSGTAIPRLAFPAFSPDRDMFRIQTHQFVYVDQSVVTGGAVYVGDLFPVGVHRVTGDGRTV